MWVHCFSVLIDLEKWSFQLSKQLRGETYNKPSFLIGLEEKLLSIHSNASSTRGHDEDPTPRVFRGCYATLSPKKETCVTLWKTAASEISVSFALIKSINFLFSCSLVSLCHSTYTTILMILKMNLIIAHLTQTGTILSKHNYLSFGVKDLKKLLSKSSRSLQKYTSLFQQYLV